MAPLADPSSASLAAYLATSTPVQAALPELLALAPAFQDAVRGRCRRNRALLADALSTSSTVSPAPSEGGWYAVLTLPEEADDEALALNLLEKDGVRCHPGFLFDLTRPAVVLSLLSEPSDMNRGVAALLERLPS